MKTKRESELEAEVIRLKRELDIIKKDVLENNGYVAEEFSKEVKKYFSYGRVRKY